MKLTMKILLTPTRLALLAALLLAASPIAAQDIYKCTKGDQLIYTDRPCPDGNGHLLHKADDAEVIDQYLRLGQDSLARQYSDSRHLEALYKDRVAAYQQAQEEKADKQANEKIAAQQREELARHQALADAASNRERLRDENNALRRQNDDYRNQLVAPAYNNPPAYWRGAPAYGYGERGGHGGHRGDHDHYDPNEPHSQQQQPVFHPCTQLAGGRVNC